VGAEADIETTSLRGTLSDTYGGVSASAEAKVNWQGSLRARAGVSLTNSSLLYVTGGLAFAQVDDNYKLTFAPGNTWGFTPKSYAENFSDIRWGYTIGGGMEQAITSLITTRIEYRFTDFGTYKNESALLPGGALNQKLIDHAVRIGASNYF
jgi:outer membrane immunogenic protein